VHIRKLSKKMMFVDIFVIDNNDLTVEKQRKKLVFKFWDLPSTMWDRTNRGKDKLHVGDSVSFHGGWQDDLFSVSSYDFITKWNEVNTSGKAFTPIPPPSSINAIESLPKKLKLAKNNNLCKYFVNTGKCETVNCLYRHDTDSEALKSNRESFVKERIQNRILEHETNFAGEGGLTPASKRCEEFAKWIVTQYGEEYLRSGIILDVAGGRGDLAFELAVKLGFDCQIVDPRPQKLKRWQVKYLKKNVNVSPPVHHTKMFEPTFFQQENIDPKTVRLVIGMHPDEATECILDVGLLNNLPVSFVPCCVFSSQFPDRRLKSGEKPTSLPEFIQYLREKSSKIQVESLPFVGRNLVLFTMPSLL